MPRLKSGTSEVTGQRLNFLYISSVWYFPSKGSKSGLNEPYLSSGFLALKN